MARKFLFTAFAALFLSSSLMAGDVFSNTEIRKTIQARGKRPPDTIETGSVKAVAARSSMIAAEENKRLDIKTGRMAAAESLKEKGSFGFPSRRLRLFTGMEYYKHVTTARFKNTVGDIGCVFGASLDLKKRHSFHALASVLFSLASPYKHTSLEISWPDDPMRSGLAESTINFTRSIEYQLGYGVILRFFPMFYIRPSFFLGSIHIQYETIHAGYHQSDVIGPDYESVVGETKMTVSSTSYLAGFSADVLINYNSRVSYFISLGYKYLFSPFIDSWSYDYDNEKMSGMYDAIMSGLSMRAGVTVRL